MRSHRLLLLSLTCATWPLAGCQPAAVAPMAASAPAAPAIQAGTATVTVRLGAMPTIRASKGDRHALAYGEAVDPFPITQVRLVLDDAGLDGGRKVLATAPWNTGTAENPAMPAPIVATIPAGLHRVVTVQALTAEGDVVLRLRSVVSAEAGQNVTMKLGFLDDLVADVVEELRRGEVPLGYQPLPVSPATLLADPLLASTVRGFLAEFMGYTSDNTFSERDFAPFRLDTQYLSLLLREHGREAFEGAGVAESKERFYQFATTNGRMVIPTDQLLPQGADPSEYTVEAIVPHVGESEYGQAAAGYWRLGVLQEDYTDPTQWVSFDLPAGTYTVVVTHHPAEGTPTRRLLQWRSEPGHPYLDFVGSS